MNEESFFIVFGGEIKVDADVFEVRCVFSPHLDKSVARSIVGDGEAQSILRFIHFHLLLDPFNVGEDKILKANLAPQQLLHINLVGV